MVHFHLSLSGCGTGSLETCTHVILMPESHTALTLPQMKFYPDIFPYPWNTDENVTISGMQKLKGNVMKM